MYSDTLSLKLEIEQIKKKHQNQDKNIELVFSYLDELITKQENNPPRRRIGYKIDDATVETRRCHVSTVASYSHISNIHISHFTVSPFLCFSVSLFPRFTVSLFLCFSFPPVHSLPMMLKKLYLH